MRKVLILACLGGLIGNGCASAHYRRVFTERCRNEVQIENEPTAECQEVELK